ncbi:helix-turn-helix transcriptional regulator [Halobacillus sp. BAB-2008]|uniref:helix-turn-helix transcriptional regulator n=1 Tax=Halobacillus sp. BAB-2008 TaxID=1246484 RepID=UPI0002A5063B|nr:helix-turn-helix transcriptional regulator [Halobacillus sp. BAB-2008]ELK44281.1 transcriptional regulator [Halobacillus sp. BAB-2008]
MKKELRNRIPEFRARYRMTQKQLAEKVGASRQTIISIEKARYTPSLILAMEIAEALKTSVDELFIYGEDSEDL